MIDFRTWCEAKVSELAKDQQHRKALTMLGNAGYTGSFDMDLVKIIDGMSLEEAKQTAIETLERHAHAHKLRTGTFEKLSNYINQAKSVAKLQETIVNTILAAGGLAVI